jgi:hypothetical protein
MSAKLKTLGKSFGEKLQSIALLLVGFEIAVLLLTIVTGLLLDHHSILIVRADSISWLVCGLGSIVLAATALVKGPKRGAAVGVLLFSLAVFILCAARFAIV